MESDRSGGVDHGEPFNIASYSLPAMMAARVAGYEPDEFMHAFGVLHPYLNHLDQAERKLAREPLPRPRVCLHADRRSLLDYRYEDVELLGCPPQPAIPAPELVWSVRRGTLPQARSGDSMPDDRSNGVCSGVEFLEWT